MQSNPTYQSTTAHGSNIHCAAISKLGNLVLCVFAHTQTCLDLLANVAGGESPKTIMEFACSNQCSIFRQRALCNEQQSTLRL